MSCCKSELRYTCTNLNGSKHANIIHVIEVWSSIHPQTQPKRLGVFRGLVLNRLDAETSGAPGLGPKSLVTKTTWCHLRAMSHFRLVVSALSPDGRSIWHNKTSRFCPASFRPRVILVSFSRDRVK